MKLFIAFFFTFFLAACGSGNDGPVFLDPKVVLSEGNQTVRLDRDTEYSIDVPSSNNIVTIGAGNTVTYLIVTGSNNAFYVEERALVRKIQLIGANNSVSLSNTVTVPSFEITGANTKVSISAGDKVDRILMQGGNTTVNILDLSAQVPLIDMTSSNNTIFMPFGFRIKTTITDTGANNFVTER